MQETLNKYRESNGITKKEMASLLEISTQEYKDIESGKNADIDGDLLERINQLIEPKMTTIKPMKTKGFQTFDALNSHLKPFGPLQDKINNLIGFQNPINDFYKEINKPLASTLAIGKMQKGFVGSMPAFTISQVLNDITAYKPEQPLGFLTQTINDVNAITAITESQRKTFDIFSKGYMKSIFEPSLELAKLVTDIKTPTQNLSFLTESVLENQKLFNNYLDFNSNLTKSLIGASAIDSYFSAENFLSDTKELTAFDVISGTTFLGQMKAFNDFEEEEIEVINEIENNADIQAEALSFLNDLTEIIHEENEEINEDELESIYNRIFNWVEKWFKGINKKALAEKILVVFISIAISIYAMNQNAEGQKQIRDGQEEINERLATQEKLSKEHNALHREDLKLRREELRREKQAREDNSEKHFILESVGNTHLRRNPNVRSKILSIITKGEVITVVDIKLRWMQVIYTNTKDGTTYEGWVSIGFFESTK